jgi:hypothetical protein
MHISEDSSEIQQTYTWTLKLTTYKYKTIEAIEQTTYKYINISLLFLPTIEQCILFFTFRNIK